MGHCSGKKFSSAILYNASKAARDLTFHQSAYPTQSTASDGASSQDFLEEGTFQMLANRLQQQRIGYPTTSVTGPRMLRHQ